MQDRAPLPQVPVALQHGADESHFAELEQASPAAALAVVARAAKVIKSAMARWKMLRDRVEVGEDMVIVALLPPQDARRGRLDAQGGCERWMREVSARGGCCMNASTTIDFHSIGVL